MNQYYNSKAKASFRTKLNLFIYEHVLSPDEWTFDVESFNRFQITPEKVQEYSTEYWQSSYTDKIRDRLEVKTIAERIASVRKNHKTIIERFQSHYIKDVFPAVFPLDLFENLTSATKCCYCGVTCEEIEKLANLGKLNKKKDRGWKLEVDRLDSNLEYRADNSVMCCYWCNNAKTDEFTHDEFVELGKAIRKVWDDRLKAKDS